MKAGELIRERRKERGLSLVDVASHLGTTKSYQSLLESGKRVPTEDQILDLARLLDLSPELLCLASGRLPQDVDEAVQRLAFEVTSFTRQRTEANALQIPESLSEHLQSLLARSAASRRSYPTEPYTGNLKTGKNCGSYRTHSYHTKVPPDAIVPIIEHYTKPGDIVLDPFCGSGMTGVAALRTDRNAILSDLSPSAVHIARNYVTNCDYADLEEAFHRIERKVAPTMAWLYDFVNHEGSRCTVEYTTWSDRFECPHCNANWSFWNAVHNSSSESLGDALVCFSCSRQLRKADLLWIGDEPVESNVSSAGKRRIVGPPTMRELELVRQANDSEIPYFIPDVPFEDTREMWRASHRAMGINTVADFYSRRNLHALAALRHEILQEPDERVRMALMFAFTAIVNRASKRYQWNAKRPTNVMTGTLYISSLRYEWNVWSLFQRKMRDVLRYYQSFPEQNGEQAEVVLSSATDLSFVPDRSVDLVFMDPPFGSNIFYSDVSLLWEAWLGTLTDSREEMIVSKRQRDGSNGKSLDDYSSLLGKAFEEARRVLKPGASAILVFSNTNDAVWEAIQKALDHARLEVQSTCILDKVQRSIKGVQADLGKQRVNRLDLMLTLRPSKSRASSFARKSGPMQDEVRAIVCEYLQQAGEEGATTDEVFFTRSARVYGETTESSRGEYVLRR